MNQLVSAGVHRRHAVCPAEARLVSASGPVYSARMTLACALAALLVAPAAGQAAPASEGPAVEATPDDRAARSHQAALAHAGRRYAEAAREYEALHAEYHDTALLLAAARSRLAAGHNAHAVAYLSQLVASGQLTAADTQVAYGELQAAQRAVTPVTVRVQLPSALAADSPRLTAHYVSRFTDEQRPPIEFLLPPGAGPVRVVILQLDPGPWRLQIAEGTLAPVDVLVDVLVQPGPPIELDLRPDEAPRGLPRTQRHRLAAFLGGLGGGLLGGGAGLVAHAELVRVRPALAWPPGVCADRTDCRKEVAAAVTERSLGAGLLGAGAGAMIGGLTALLRDARQRRISWIVELALGGAGVVGGGLAVAFTAREFDRENVDSARPWGDPDYVAAISQRSQRHTLAAGGLGLASGLALSAATGLAYTRTYNRRHPDRFGRRVRPGLGLGRAGLGVTLSGRF